MFAAALQFAPQFAMYKLLQLLENDRNLGPESVDAWSLVFLLGLAMTISAWGDTWSAWIGYSRLALPIRSELSALVFQKSTRRKDVREAQANEQDGNGVHSTQVLQRQLTNTSLNATKMDSLHSPTDPNVEKSRQSTINLVVGNARTRPLPFWNEALTMLRRVWMQSELLISWNFTTSSSRLLPRSLSA